MDIALVELVEVIFDIGAGQRCSAEEDGVVGGAGGVHLEEIVFHDDRRLHQKSGHADDVSLVFRCGVENVGNGLFDAQVNHVVAVIGQDDVHEVFPDIVDVSFDRGQDDLSLGRGVVGSLHELFQVGYGCFHRFS